jgi:hypothetical protein
MNGKDALVFFWRSRRSEGMEGECVVSVLVGGASINASGVSAVLVLG